MTNLALPTIFDNLEDLIAARDLFENELVRARRSPSSDSISLRKLNDEINAIFESKSLSLPDNRLSNHFDAFTPIEKLGNVSFLDYEAPHNEEEFSIYFGNGVLQSKEGFRFIEVETNHQVAITIESKVFFHAYSHLMNDKIEWFIWGRILHLDDCDDPVLIITDKKHVYLRRRLGM